MAFFPPRSTTSILIQPVISTTSRTTPGIGGSRLFFPTPLALEVSTPLWPSKRWKSPLCQSLQDIRSDRGRNIDATALSWVSDSSLSLTRDATLQGVQWQGSQPSRSPPDA